MNLLDKFERKFPNFGISHLSLYLIIGQILAYALNMMQLLPIDSISLMGSKVLDGEVWRLLTFMFVPISSSNIVFALFAWYLYYLYGTALENTWGKCRYNVYILISYLLSLTAAIIFPYSWLSNTYLYATVFLAFAYLYPDFELLLFFILPVKIKWLAAIAAAGYAYLLVVGTNSDRLLLALSLSNFVIFFGKDIYMRIRHRQKKLATGIENKKTAGLPRHQCSVCGITDKQDPHAEFRYVTENDKTICYCMNHLLNRKNK